MSSRVPYRAVQAIEELEGIAIYMGSKVGEPAKVAILQVQASVAAAIEELKYAREWITEIGDRKGIPNGGTLQRIDAALRRLQGGNP